MKHAKPIAALFALLSASVSLAQVADQKDGNIANIPVNYTEAKVPTYALPDPLKMDDGQPVKDAKTWFDVRRPEILKLEAVNQFGLSPDWPVDVNYDVFDTGTLALDGKAIRKQVTINFSKEVNGPHLDLLIYIPRSATGPVPILLNINFGANNNATSDPGVKVGRTWNNQQHKYLPANPVAFGGRGPATQPMGTIGVVTTQPGGIAGRGRGPIGGGGIGRLTVDPLLNAGFAVATFNYTDVDPDVLGAVADGIRGTYLQPGQTAPADDEWGSISAWAWGISRVVDYLQTDSQIDGKKIAIMGVSRLGKTVLWAGASDQRIAAVISSSSGAGGASIARRQYGETIAHLVAPSRYPYQFCANYAKYADKVDQFPVDSNMLISLMAPRPLLVQTGNSDGWADPRGQFEGTFAATPVYQFLGKQGIDSDTMPNADTLVGHTLAFYMHTGGHGTVSNDWNVFVKFLQDNLQP